VSDSTPLSTYLNDHLAGSAFAIDLMERMRSNNEGTEFGRFLDDLQAAIEEDRAALQQVMEAVGATPRPIKQAGGRMLETLSRVKFDSRLTGSGDLSRLMETEALSLGIEGKLAGWRTLEHIPQRDLGVDLGALIQRARDQRDSLEPFRIDAAKRALS
jgi:hypothetical protein